MTWLVRFHLGAGYPALIVGHTVLPLPSVFMLVRLDLVTYEQDLERASWNPGADPVTTSCHVMGPNISPTLFAEAFIAFVVSFGEFIVTQFPISPGTSTVPVVVYSKLRTGLTPTINALSIVLIIVTLVVALSNRKLTPS